MRRDTTPIGAGGAARYSSLPSVLWIPVVLGGMNASWWAYGSGGPILFFVSGVLVVGLTLALIVGSEVDRGGIRRWTLLGTRSYSWEEIGAVRGRETLAGQSATPVVSNVVLDREGRAQFRITPWVGRRRRLVAAIRAEIHRRRAEEDAR